MPKRARDNESEVDLKRVKSDSDESVVQLPTHSTVKLANQSINQSINQPVNPSIAKSECHSDGDSDNDSQHRNDNPHDGRPDSLRKQQHQKSDKQRRAKIKEGMDKLKTLVSQHGKLESPDQASIVAASIDLVHSLRNEIVGLKGQIDAAHAHNTQQRLAIQQFQSRVASSMYTQSINSQSMMPLNNQTMSNQPMNNQSMNNQPMNNPSMNNQSVNNQSLNNPSMNNQPINQPMNNQSVNNQSMNNQSMNNQSLNNQSINDSLDTGVFARSNSLLNNGPVSNVQMAQFASQIQQLRSFSSSNPTSNSLVHQLPPLSSAQMAQITSLLQHSQMSPTADLNTLLANVAPQLTQTTQFIRNQSQSSISQQQQQQQIQTAEWD